MLVELLTDRINKKSQKSLLIYAHKLNHESLPLSL